MDESGRALGIAIPKRAPAVALKTDRDAALSTLAQKTACGTAPFLDRALNRTDLAVYVMFASHANPAGMTYVGQDRVATLLACSQQLVSKSVKRLLDRGYIKRTTKPGRNGHRQNVIRIVLDPAISEADARSIANAPQHNHHHKGVVIRTHNPQEVVINELSTSHTTPQRNTITTRINGHQSLPPDGSQNCELIKPSHNELKSADEAIALWIAYAWKHGQNKPIANDDDLAIAHELVTRHITAAQLETAILPDPESARLKPLVRDLLR
jgi:DNA-binding MarR family transcriptional regulator